MSQAPIQSSTPVSTSNPLSSKERPRSAEMYAQAREILVGGVNSPVRAFRGVGGSPLFIDRAEGPYLFDADGNQYIDYVLSWGPAILGHAHPAVTSAIAAQAVRGTSFGAPCGLEVELARRLQKAVPSMEKIRFVSSGTEATMSALRLARGATGRDKILKFDGCYHGHADSLLVKAGSGVATLGLPDSPGVPADLAQHTLTAPYNDEAAVRDLFVKHGKEIACIIVEPVAGNMGCVPPTATFLPFLREICTAHGALLIFDEVMTGFRVALGGAQAHYGIDPDLTCLGKVIGGGLPVGAFGGKRSIMSNLAPEGPVYQAGTLSGNPLAMAAGIVVLDKILQEVDYEKLTAATHKVASGIVALAHKYGLDAVYTQVGSMFSVFFAKEVPQNYDEVKKSDAAFFKKFFWQMLDHGVYLAPSAFEAGFTSVLHDDNRIQETLQAAESAFMALTQR